MSERPIEITITSGTIVKAIVVVALALFVFLIRDIVLIVLTAIVIASAIEPGVAALVRRKVPRALSVIFVYLILFSFIFIFFFFFIPSLFADFTSFIAGLPEYLKEFTSSGTFDQYSQLLGLPPLSNISVNDLMTGIRSALSLDTAFGNAVSAITYIFGGVFSSILIVIFSFYFAVIETGVDDFLRVVTPRRHQAYVQGLWKRSQNKIGLWLQGQLLLALIIGILVYLGLMILGVPHALTLAVVAAVCEIIPVFGPVLAAIPGVGIALVSGGVTLGLLTVALYVITQQFENHLIYPLVVSRVVGVPPLLVILALIIGGELAGFLGVILSVPAAATIQELVRDLESGRLAKEEQKGTMAA